MKISKKFLKKLEGIDRAIITKRHTKHKGPEIVEQEVVIDNEQDIKKIVDTLSKAERYRSDFWAHNPDNPIYFLYLISKGKLKYNTRIVGSMIYAEFGSNSIVSAEGIRGVLDTFVKDAKIVKTNPLEKYKFAAEIEQKSRKLIEEIFPEMKNSKNVVFLEVGPLSDLNLVVFERKVQKNGLWMQQQVIVYVDENGEIYHGEDVERKPIDISSISCPEGSFVTVWGGIQLPCWR